MIAFVILHYQTIEETDKCVESILGMNKSDEARIIIVDNASPNGSGKKLQEKWKDNPQVEVILSDTNEGFSKGNNRGCIYARDTWNPDFYVVANNDIIFGQKEFIELIKQEYDKSGYYVLGPDIYDITNRVHQSPVAEREPSMKRVKQTIALNSLCLALFQIAYPLMKICYSRHKDKYTDVAQYNIYQENPLIMGACIVFAKKYVEERLQEYKKHPFEPETRFYYEEAIMRRWCRMNGKKVLYCKH